MKRILAIDDEQDVTDLVKLQLESMGGFTVVTENEGAGAIMTARETSPDLILLDIMMPDVDGSELAAQMLEDPLLKDTPIIFLTALVSDEEVRAGNFGAGSRRYFPKPINFQKLASAIHETLGNNVSS
jgi:two-component system alkaline phosphatase synthesis response regulator PhoP